MKKLMLQSILLFAVLFTACKKDGPDPIAPISKTSLLTDGTWKLTALVSDDDGNGTYELNEFPFLEQCFIDNFYTFKANFQLEMNEGPTKCDPVDPQIDVATWSLSNNETNLVINSDTYTIIELTNTTLKFKETGPANTSSIITFTKR